MELSDASRVEALCTFDNELFVNAVGFERSRSAMAADEQADAEGPDHGPPKLPEGWYVVFLFPLEKGSLMLQATYVLNRWVTAFCCCHLSLNLAHMGG